MTTSSYFSHDRFLKYYWGCWRLLFIVIVSFAISKDNSTTFHEYFFSCRWLGHAYVGSIGAAVNVNMLDRRSNILLLAVAAIYCIFDVVYFNNASMAIYLAKTFGGDFFAGKLDTLEWKLVLSFVIIFLGGLIFSDIDVNFGSSSMVSQYSRIFAFLVSIQFICEYGDNHFEQLSFFRYRYSFEVLTLALLVFLYLKPQELYVTQIDLVICLFYRLSNTLIIAVESGKMMVFFKMILFRIFGFIHSVPVLYVDDPDVAMLVMKNSAKKGFGLEKVLSVPAWQPVLSLESEDNTRWENLHRDFHILLQKHCPPVSKLLDICNFYADELIAKDCVIDAEAIATLTAKCFVHYLFDREWEEGRFNILVRASWEWRMEISVHGKADMSVKAQAIKLLVEDLIFTCKPLWAVYGERWGEPRYFSLLLQPFLISPCINVGDIMVALKLSGPHSSVEDAVRVYHPFPILERFVEQDLHNKDGQLVVPKNTQVIMFTQDITKAYPESKWPIFGSGPRVCAGAHLALPFLKLLRSKFVEESAVDGLNGISFSVIPGQESPAVEKDSRNISSSTSKSAARFIPNFQPDLNHRFSGRNNDGKADWMQSLFFVKTIVVAIIRESFYNPRLPNL